MQYTTGSQALDELMGGYNTGVLHCFYGVTGAGKTTLSAYNPIAQIHKVMVESKKLDDNHKYIVVDGDGGFDMDRLAQVCHGAGIDDVDSVFDHLQYYQPVEFKAQHDYIVDMDKTIKNKKWLPLFIAADPMVAIYRGNVMRSARNMKMATIGDMTGRLDQQLTVLRQLAVDYGMVAVCSSWPGSAVGDAMGAKPGETPVIGGRAFGYFPKLMVEIRRPNEFSHLREAYLFKHRSKPSGKTCFFSLTEDGVSDITDEEVATQILRTA